MKKHIAIVVPVYNEAECIEAFDAELRSVFKNNPTYRWSVTYCDDGSSDASYKKLAKIVKHHTDTAVLSLSRNFGKEIATTAGIIETSADAIITIDADGQHPVEMIPEFVSHWESGAQVVTGIRKNNETTSIIKRLGSAIFYRLLQKFSRVEIPKNLTDFRLIDHEVKEAFESMTERNRMSRGMVQWLGFETEYIRFTARKRLAGEPSYSMRKLNKLAIDSIISMSTSPLLIATYLGAAALIISIMLTLGMVINSIIHDPWHLNVTGSAYLVVMVLFMVGILLISQGIIGLYLARIYSETQNRPLYVINKARSITHKSVRDEASST